MLVGYINRSDLFWLNAHDLDLILDGVAVGSARDGWQRTWSTIHWIVRYIDGIIGYTACIVA